MDTLIIVILLLILSAICSGLNIALMSLNLPEIKRKAKLGDKEAKKVLPFRKNAHLTLTSIVLTNVGVISATSLVLDEHFNGLIAGVMSTLLIVIFGELGPQAFFTRHALSACAKLAPMMRLMVIATYVVAKPLQLMMDRLFGKHNDWELHSRRELGLIIHEHSLHDSELDDDEVEIIKGALLLSEKKVEDIMTPIDSVYWLSISDTIDDEKIDEIKNAGRSRIPVFDDDKTSCYGIVRMKDMVDVDFDEKPKPVSKLKIFPVKPVGSRTALDTMFRKFISARTHMIPIEKSDRIIGIVTIEDLIEEIIGHEILDESDQILERT